MKASITRILSLLLVAMMAITIFAGCTQQPKDTTPTDVTPTETTPESVPEPVIVGPEDDDPYTISKDADGKDVVILTPNDDGTATMNVAEGTTLEQFFTLVTAKEGYTQKVTDAEGNEVTDPAALIADGMTYAVYADGETDPAKQFAIHVESQEKIEETVSQAAVVSQQIAKAESQRANQTSSKGKGNGKTDSSKNTKSSTPSKDPGSPDTPSSKDETPMEDIILSTIWDHNYQASDNTGNAWQSTFKNMEKKYHIRTIIDPHLDAATATDLIVKDVMAGKARVDIYEVSLVRCRDIAKRKAAANIYKSKTINKDVFNTSATKSVTFNGKVYGVAFASNALNPVGVIYNKDLIKKYAPEYDIAKLYKEKKWDFDAMRAVAKLCTRDTNGDGKTDIYGVTSNTNLIGMAITNNAGATADMVNGRVVPVMCSDEGIRALEWCKALWKDDKSWKYFGDITDAVPFFASGQCAMFASYLQYYPNIASLADFDFGFVLMAMGPDKSDYINAVYDSSLYIVPKTRENRLDVIGNWLNGAATMSSKIITFNVQKMARNGFDKTSTDAYKWVVAHMTPEFSSGVFSGKIASQVDGSVTSPSKSPSKVMTAIKTAAQAECDDYYADLY